MSKKDGKGWGLGLLKKAGDGTALKITLKGRAVIAAVDAGLLPEVDGGWDDTGFLRFWEEFEPDLRKEIQKEVNHTVMVLCQQCEQRADNRTEKRIKKLESAVRFLFGAFLVHLIGGILKFL